MYLPLDTFKTIIQHTPLVSIDLVVENEQGEILLGCRNNRPAKGYWFVPGGRILKDESLAAAFKRLTLHELGKELCLSDAQFIGPFEHFYTDNVTTEAFTTHYVVLAYRLSVNASELNLPLDQHSRYAWMTIDHLLAHEKVHRHTRWYFEPSSQTLD